MNVSKSLDSKGLPAHWSREAHKDYFETHLYTQSPSLSAATRPRDLILIILLLLLLQAAKRAGIKEFKSVFRWLQVFPFANEVVENVLSTINSWMEGEGKAELGGKMIKEGDLKLICKTYVQYEHDFELDSEVDSGDESEEEGEGGRSEMYIGANGRVS